YGDEGAKWAAESSAAKIHDREAAVRAAIERAQQMVSQKAARMGQDEDVESSESETDRDDFAIKGDWFELHVFVTSPALLRLLLMEAPPKQRKHLGLAFPAPPSGCCVAGGALLYDGFFVLSAAFTSFLIFLDGDGASALFLLSVSPCCTSTAASIFLIEPLIALRSSPCCAASQQEYRQPHRRVISCKKLLGDPGLEDLDS
ncbi:hypothetical protein CYMTET_13028, partial [Cymbomonas tetramitiformis]